MNNYLIMEIEKIGKLFDYTVNYEKIINNNNSKEELTIYNDTKDSKIDILA